MFIRLLNSYCRTTVPGSRGKRLMTFDAEKVYQELYPRYPGRVRRDEALSRHGTFGVGGPADVWVTLETSEELLDLASRCMAERWPLLLVGNGTNVLYADS